MITSNWCNIEHNKGHRIFTDGSRIDNKVGAGIAIYRDNVLVKEISIRLNNDATVFMAEAYAIKIALEEAANEQDTTHIFSDSRSVLMALETPLVDQQIIFEIKLLLQKNSNFCFHWVKAHIGIIENEKADTLAKDGAQLNTIGVNLGIPKSKIKLLLRNQVQADWQNRWNCSDKARHTYALFPRVDVSRIYGDFFINQLLTNHGCIPIYQSRFFGKEPKCECGADGTVDHIVFHCTIFSTIRKDYFPSKFEKFDLCKLINFKRARVGLSTMMHNLLTKSIDN